MRFRPVLMTAFSFILGMIPLVIAQGAGAASRQYLGTAVLGGMFIATIGGVLFIPWLYKVVQGGAEKFGAKRRRRRQMARPVAGLWPRRRVRRPEGPRRVEAGFGRLGAWPMPD